MSNYKREIYQFSTCLSCYYLEIYLICYSFKIITVLFAFLLLSFDTNVDLLLLDCATIAFCFIVLIESFRFMVSGKSGLMLLSA